MRRELKQNQEELKEVEKHQEQLSEGVEQNREDIITNRKLITEITIDIDLNKKEIADLTTSLDGQIAAIEVTIAAFKHNDTQLQSQIIKLQDNFDDLMHDIDILNLTTLDKFNVLNGDINTMKHDIKAIQDKVIELNITDSGLKTAIENLKDDLEVLQIKFDDLSTKTTHLETTSYHHGIRLNNLDGVVSGLRIDFNYLEKRVDDLNQTDKGIDNLVGNINDKINQLAEELDAVSEKSEQDDEALLVLINPLISDLRTDLQTLSNRVELKDANLQAAIDKVDADLTKLENDLVAVADKIITLESRFNSINTKLNSINIKIGKMEDIDTDLNEEIESLKTELKKLTDHSNLRDDQLKKLVDGLQIQINDLKNELNRIEQKSNQVDAQLRSEIRDAEKNLDELSQQLSKYRDYIWTSKQTINRLTINLTVILFI